MDQYIHATSIKCLFSLLMKNPKKSLHVKTLDETT